MGMALNSEPLILRVLTVFSVLASSDGSTEDNQSTAHDDSRAYLQHRDNSTPSVRSRNSDRNDIYSATSLSDDDHDLQTKEMDKDSIPRSSKTEASISDDEKYDSVDIAVKILC
jgi:hypothetical protein